MEEETVETVAAEGVAPDGPRAGYDARRPRVRELQDSREYKKLRRDLMAVLKGRGVTERYYIDLVEDYMDSWVERALLTDEIFKRGAAVTQKNGAQKFVKCQDFVQAKLKLQAHMLGILDLLGVKPLGETSRGGVCDGWDD